MPGGGELVCTSGRNGHSEVVSPPSLEASKGWLLLSGDPRAAHLGERVGRAEGGTLQCEVSVSVSAPGGQPPGRRSCLVFRHRRVLPRSQPDVQGPRLVLGGRTGPGQWGQAWPLRRAARALIQETGRPAGPPPRAGRSPGHGAAGPFLQEAQAWARRPGSWASGAACSLLLSYSWLHEAESARLSTEAGGQGSGYLQSPSRPPASCLGPGMSRPRRRGRQAAGQLASAASGGGGAHREVCPRLLESVWASGATRLTPQPGSRAPRTRMGTWPCWFCLSRTASHMGAHTYV